MKKLILTTLVALTSLILKAQNFEFPMSQDSTIMFQNTVQCEGNAVTLYGKAKVWFSNVFKNSKSVIESDDQQNFILIGKGYSDIKAPGRLVLAALAGEECHFTLKIECKDGRYRASFYTIYSEDESALAGHFSRNLDAMYSQYKQGIKSKAIRDRYEQYFLSVTELMTSLNTSLKNSMINTKTSDF